MCIDHDRIARILNAHYRSWCGALNRPLNTVEMELFDAISRLLHGT